MSEKAKEREDEEKTAKKTENDDSDNSGGDEVDGADTDGDNGEKAEVEGEKGKKFVKKESYRQKDQPKPEEKKKAMKEDIDNIFAGQELSEETQTKVATLFESAVNERVSAEVDRIEEAAQEEYKKTVAELEESYSAKIDAYLSEVVNEWAEENRIAIETGIRLEIAESFMDNLKGLFESHYVEVPESKMDLVDELTTKVSELEESLNESVKEKMELKQTISEQKADVAFREVAEGLTDTQVERLKTLSEGFDVTDTVKYKEKLTIVKEAHFADSDNESLDEGKTAAKQEDLSEGADPQMERYLAALKKRTKF